MVDDRTAMPPCGGPSDEALERFAIEQSRGTPDPTIKQHIQSCARCAETAKRLANEIEAIQNSLGQQTLPTRDHCPGAESLAQLVDGAPDAARRREIESHLADCPDCRIETVALLRQLQAIEAAADSELASPPESLDETRKQRPVAPPPESEIDAASDEDEEGKSKESRQQRRR